MQKLTKELLIALLKDINFSVVSFSKEEFAYAILLGGRVSDTLRISNQKCSNSIKKLFPNKKPRQSYINYILITNNLKLCNTCSLILSTDSFGKNSTNGDGLSSACYGCHNKQQSTYYYNNPEAQVSRVRKRDRNLDRSLTQVEILSIFYKYDYKCAYCKYDNDNHNIDYGENLHLDHIIPFSKGGLTIVDNTQLLCRPCNSKKSNKIGL